MIDTRHLIKEIPSGKYHSVLMTSYNINLYYWNIQLLKTLSAKGVNFVSAVVDSDCLSDELYKFCSGLSHNKPLEFSLHGFKSKGAFHPKIQFYAGNNSILVLIGSGNITVSGHGRNLEIWNPVVVDSVNSPSYAFVRQVWDYLTGIYNGLGDEARNIISTIEDNCILLQGEYDKTLTEHQLDDFTSIRLFTNGKHSINAQCSDWINDDKINTITILSPFYDSHAAQIQSLVDRYHPQKVRIIVEEGFGSVPMAKYLPENVEVYKWQDIIKDSDLKRQKGVYHAKCFFFTGERYNYMLCGSANASVAAFGLTGVDSINYETSVGYKSTKTDYFLESRLVLRQQTNIESIKFVDWEINNHPQENHSVWIKEASYYSADYDLTLESANENKGAIRFFSSSREILYEKIISLRRGINTVSGNWEKEFVPLYVEFCDENGNIISNRQFVISSYSMDINNPSPATASYRKRIHEIETGNFVNGAVLRFIEQILDDTESKISTSSKTETKVDNKDENSDGFKFASFEEYMKDDGRAITGDYRYRKENTSNSQSTLLFDSIINYIAKSSAEKKDEMIDDEETEDVQNAKGKSKQSKSQENHLKTTSESEVRKRIIKMLDKYIAEISAFNENKTISEMNEIKRFMTLIFFINRTLGYRYFTDNQKDVEQQLIDIVASKFHHRTLTEYLYRSISVFSVHMLRSSVIKGEGAISEKLKSYKQYVFELCLAIVSVCDWLNEGNNCYEDYDNLYKLPMLMTLKQVLNTQVTPSIIDDILSHLDRDIQELTGYDEATIRQKIFQNVLIMNNNQIIYPKGRLYFTNMFGYTYLKELNQNIALPCTMAVEYNQNRKLFCPEYGYLYKAQKLLQLKPKQL